MPSSHLCVQCGFDLARIRAQRDPQLGLWLVQCPECERFAARRRQHPAVLWFRNFRKLDWTLGLLAVQTVLLFFATLFTMMAIVYTAEELFSRSFERQQIEIAIIYFIIPALVGLWLTAGFPHLARWKVWLGWGGWILSIVAVSFTMQMLDAMGNWAWYGYGNAPIAGMTVANRWQRALEASDASMWLQGLIYLPWQLVALWVGWPLGRFARWFFLTVRRTMFRYRLRRRRVAFQN